VVDFKKPLYADLAERFAFLCRKAADPHQR
jgi:hypothetical protein